MTEKGLVFFAVGMALLFILRFSPVETRPMTADASGQSTETNVLMENSAPPSCIHLVVDDICDN